MMRSLKGDVSRSNTTAQHDRYVRMMLDGGFHSAHQAGDARGFKCWRDMRRGYALASYGNITERRSNSQTFYACAPLYGHRGLTPTT